MNPFEPTDPTLSLVCNICRHGAGDRECSKNGYQYYGNGGSGTTAAERELLTANSTLESLRAENARLVRAAATAAAASSPDSLNYEVIEVKEVGRYTILKVKYPNCSSCAYEGVKIMVMEDVKPLDGWKWRKIDPHFRSPTKTRAATEAPPPIARFPGTKQGWDDAILFCVSRDSKGVVKALNLG